MNLVLKIDGMTCAGCSVAIQEQLSRVRGVDRCSVNPIAHKATLKYNAEEVGISEIEEAVQKAGYKVVYDEITVRTDSSQTHQQMVKRLRQMPGVRDVVTGSGSEITVRYNPAMLNPDHIAGIKPQAGQDRALRCLAVSAVFSAPAIALGLMYDPGAWQMYIAFGCAAVVQFFAGRELYVGAWRMAQARTAGMDTLIVLGTSAAFFYSMYSVLWTPQSGSVYFETSAVIITAVLLGRYLESRAGRRASSALTDILKMQPDMATMITDGVESEIATDSLRPKDTILVRPGQKIPADSRVISGSSYVDESMVTGESTPIFKSGDDLVIGGTMNVDGILTLEVRDVGSDSFLARVVVRVEDAISERPPAQKMADVVAGRLSFVIMSISLATFFLWSVFGTAGSIAQALIPAVAVLVVSCPCALGLATPTAATTGMGVAASMGIIFRDGKSLESLAKIDIVVFDKTGTLTRGSPQVTKVVTVGDISEDELLMVAASAQYGSRHPLARATTAYAQERGIKTILPQEFTAISGMGVKATVQGRSILVGSAYMMTEYDISIDESVLHPPAGGTTYLVASEDRLMGALHLVDELKPTAREAVDRLTEMGIETAILTGDAADASTDVANKIGVRSTSSRMLPGDKADAIACLQREGKRVAMVGDGINDAPALSQADVGVAMGGGTDIAIESGDVILMHGEPTGVADAVDISRRTYGKMKQNLIYAFAYNMVLIPVAGLGLLHPAMAGVAMAASSVSVVANSLLLGRLQGRSRPNTTPSEGISEDGRTH